MDRARLDHLSHCAHGKPNVCYVFSFRFTVRKTLPPVERERERARASSNGVRLTYFARAGQGVHDPSQQVKCPPLFLFLFRTHHQRTDFVQRRQLPRECEIFEHLPTSVIQHTAEMGFPLCRMFSLFGLADPSLPPDRAPPLRPGPLDAFFISVALRAR